jgi:hypothetical protein
LLQKARSKAFFPLWPLGQKGWRLARPAGSSLALKKLRATN